MIPAGTALRNWNLAIMRLRLSWRAFKLPYEAEVNGKMSNLRFNTDTALSFGPPYFPNPLLRNFAPRIGLSWDPFGDGKTAIRSAFGIFHDEIAMVWFQQPAFRMPPTRPFRRFCLMAPAFSGKELPEGIRCSTRSSLERQGLTPSRDGRSNLD